MQDPSCLANRNKCPGISIEDYPLCSDLSHDPQRLTAGLGNPINNVLTEVLVHLDHPALLRGTCMAPQEGTDSTKQGLTQSVLAQDHLSCSLGTLKSLSIQTTSQKAIAASWDQEVRAFRVYKQPLSSHPPACSHRWALTWISCTNYALVCTLMHSPLLSQVLSVTRSVGRPTGPRFIGLGPSCVPRLPTTGLPSFGSQMHAIYHGGDSQDGWSDASI